MIIKPRRAIQLIEPYNPPQENRKKKLRLDFNENTVGCSPKVIEALKSISAPDLSTYPEYNNSIGIMAEYFEVQPGQVMVTNGSDEAIRAVMQTYLDNGEEVVLPAPTYAMFKFYASLQGGKIREVLYNDDFSFPTKKVLKAINEKTRIIVLVNPDSPTGAVIPKQDIVRILEKGKGSVVLLDEAYSDYLGKTGKGLISKYDNLIITKTFSKAFGLAGLRIGVILSNKGNIKNLKKGCSPYSVNSIGLIAVEAAIKDQVYTKEYAAMVNKSKKSLVTSLKGLGLQALASGANFFLVNFGVRCAEICQKLRARRILIRNRSKDPLLSGWARITVGTAEQNSRLVRELRDILEQEALLFDMDGVLVDESASYREAIKKTFEFFSGKKVTEKEIGQVKATGAYNNDWKCTRELLRQAGVDVGLERVTEKFQEYYLGNNFDGLISKEKWLLPIPLLEKLSQDYVLGIVTGRPREEAEYALEQANAKQYFLAMVCMGEAKEKPDPDGIKKIMSLLGAKKAVYLGDTVADALCASSADIPFIGVLPPQNKTSDYRQRLVQSGAQSVVSSISQIQEVLK